MSSFSFSTAGALLWALLWASLPLLGVFVGAFTGAFADGFTAGFGGAFSGGFAGALVEALFGAFAGGTLAGGGLGGISRRLLGRRRLTVRHSFVTAWLNYTSNSQFNPFSQPFSIINLATTKKSIERWSY